MGEEWLAKDIEGTTIMVLWVRVHPTRSKVIRSIPTRTM